jgi:hypothetical protein
LQRRHPSGIIPFVHLLSSLAFILNPHNHLGLACNMECRVQAFQKVCAHHMRLIQPCLPFPSTIQLPSTSYPLFDSLPEDIVKGGKLSQLQLEGVLYACTKHQELLPSGQRMQTPHTMQIVSGFASMWEIVFLKTDTSSNIQIRRCYCLLRLELTH